ncbi:MAG: hypothetical protein CHACPFDD_03782 [Phycisphaerae bacterium]|nr:hypothetical protein [Phycisphaerae bacterium]
MLHPRPTITARLGPPRGGVGRAASSLTAGGAMFIGASLVIGLAAINASINLLFLLFGMLIGVMLVSGRLARRCLRRATVTREAPDAVVAGRPFTVRYRVSNARPRGAAHSLRIRERVRCGAEVLQLEGYLAVVPAGAVECLDVQVVPPGRGVLQFDRVRLSTRFPFGLFAQRLDVAAEHATTVYPALLHLRRQLARAPDHRMRQATASREHVRGGDEFYGLREYRNGDNLRWIHWRRSARMGKLLVREMVDPRPSSIMVVLDPGRAAATPIDRERAISAAGTIICHALEEGFRAGLVVLTRSPVVIPPTAGRGLRAKFLSKLAAIEMASPADVAASLAEQRWPAHWRCRCVLVGPVSDESLWQTANVLRGRSAGLDVVTAADSEFANWFQTRGAGEPRVAAGAGDDD